MLTTLSNITVTISLVLSFLSSIMAQIRSFWEGARFGAMMLTLQYEYDQDTKNGLVMIARAGSSDMTEYLMLNYIWLGWAVDPGQEQGKSSRSCTQREASFDSDCNSNIADRKSVV